MSKLPSVSGKEAVAVFEKHGFTVVRTSSSHHIMKRAGHRFTISVPVHGSKTIKPGLLRRLIRDAGMTIDEFTASL